jgi:hypothetical protein
MSDVLDWLAERMNSQCRRKGAAANAAVNPAVRAGSGRNVGDNRGTYRRKKARSMWSGLNPYQEETWRRQVLIYTST